MDTGGSDGRRARARYLAGLSFLVIVAVTVRDWSWLTVVKPPPESTAVSHAPPSTGPAPASPTPEPSPSPSPTAEPPPAEEAEIDLAGPIADMAAPLAAVSRGEAIPLLIEQGVRALPAVLRLIWREEVPLLHPAITPSALRFIAIYGDYTRTIRREMAALSEAAAPRPTSRDLTALRRRVSRRHAGRYRKAMQAADSHLANFAASIGGVAKSRSTYLLVHKSRCLVSLVDSERNEIYAVFPSGVGCLPGQKERRGDLRTPECPPERRTRGSTPFYAAPLIPGDPYPTGGAITRGIGVSSTDPEFGFLEHGWLIMFHGTPDQESMGTRSSLGCIRLLPRHIEVLFDYVHENARVVITP